MTGHSERPADPPVPFFIRFIATGCFSGYSPVASGTAGSLVAVALYAIPRMHTDVVLGVATLAAIFIGTYVSGVMEHTYGEDPPIVVIDEVAGMWLSLLFLPVSIAVTALAFVLFRIYDIFKPPPARQLERVKGGWGIMLDDVAAGIYANLTVRLILLAIPSLR